MKLNHAVALMLAWSAVPGAVQADEGSDVVTPTFSLDSADAAPVGTVGSAAYDHLRKVLVDASSFTGRSDAEWVAYNLDTVLRAVSSRQVAQLPEWAVAVRLVLSEVGADRLIQSQYGLVEAMGVIETVHNRLDPVAWNPAGIAGVRPWPGCGEGGTFGSCANPQQYYGMSRDRALNPASAYRNREMLLSAIDMAVSAWWMLETDVVADVTGGATSFHHACGGAAYGAEPSWCDGAGRDASGANPVTGPVVFKGPGRWLASQGRYDTAVTKKIDYRARGEIKPGMYAQYLWGDRGLGWRDIDFVTPGDVLDQVWYDGLVDDPTDTGSAAR